VEPDNRQLADLTVIELAGSVAGGYCSSLFAMLGAQVTVVGPDRLPDFQRRYLRRHVARFVDTDGRGDLDLTDVDVLIESSASGMLPPRSIDTDQTIHVRLSPFGETGPYSSWRSSDLVDYAVSGHAHLYGHPDRAPLAGPPDQPAVASGLFAFIGAMAALLDRRRSGKGQRVEVNHLRSMVSLHQVTLLRWMLAGDVLTRMGNRYTGQGQPNGPYRCADGWISVVGVTDPQVESLLAVTGLTHLLDDPRISSPMDLQAHPEVLDEPLCEWLRGQRVDEVVDLFQAMRIPTCPLRSPLELLDDPQLAARGFLQPVDGDHGPLVPGSPFSFSHHQEPGGRGWQPEQTPGDGPLAGLRVLDLARVWAGPLCARILSDLGADVIWVEAPLSRGPRELPQSFVDAASYFPDNDAGERPWNRNGHMVKYSLGKRSLSIDLQTEAGVQAFERLVPDAHVLLENYSSRVMPQFGLDEGRLHELNPDLVYLTMPGYGRSGPAEHWLAYGSCIDSHAGLSNLIGYPDEVPWKGGIAWPDPVAGLHACSAVLASLWASADRGGGGCTIEAAQFESTIAAIGDRILQAQLGDPFDPSATPDGVLAQGVFRCEGDDAWIAITIAGPDGAAELRRLAGHDDTVELTTVMAALTSDREAEELARELQDRGIAAAPVRKAPAVLDDEHLAAQHAWVTVDQPDIGPFTAPVAPIDLSSAVVAVRAPAPTLGQHNREILVAAGFADAEIRALEADDVIADRPTL